MRALNWTPTDEEVQTAQDVLAWAYREMTNEITPETFRARKALEEGEDGAEERCDSVAIEEASYNGASATGRTMINRAWRRAVERTKQYEYGIKNEDEGKGVLWNVPASSVIGFARERGWAPQIRRINTPVTDQEDLEAAIEYLESINYTVTRKEI